MESAITAMSPARSPISRTVISVMPLTVSTIPREIAPTKPASHVKISASSKAPIAISKIAVPIIASLSGTGKSPTAHGSKYPPHASGFLKIKIPIHKNVIASPTRKIWKDDFFMSDKTAYEYYTFHEPNRKRGHEAPKTPGPNNAPLEIGEK